MIKTFYIKTFGCWQNQADSQRIKSWAKARGWRETDEWKKADVVIINSCVVRESAENRAWGWLRKTAGNKRVILTGCLVGILNKKTKKPGVNVTIMPIDKFGFEIKPKRKKGEVGLVSVGNGCNNFCSYCIVPYSRGRERYRSFEEILKEAKELKEKGFCQIRLIGQNVNSYPNFAKLLEKVAKMGFDKVNFISSNPWNFDDELIKVIAKNKNIDRRVHLPLQSGDDEILKKMRRNYTAKSYLNLIHKIRARVKGVEFSTDIIVGFPGEDQKAFENTINLCKQTGFVKAYINKYSPRPGTLAAKLYKDNVTWSEKRRRWQVLEEMINKPKISVQKVAE